MGIAVLCTGILASCRISICQHRSCPTATAVSVTDALSAVDTYCTLILCTVGMTDSCCVHRTVDEQPQTCDEAVNANFGSRISLSFRYFVAIVERMCTNFSSRCGAGSNIEPRVSVNSISSHIDVFQEGC